MTSLDRLERDLPMLLDELATPRSPDYIEESISQTAARRQRPGWSFPERWLPMSAITTPIATSPRVPLRFLAVVALLIVAVIVAAVVAGTPQRRLPEPFGIAANGRIAYAAGGDIYTVDRETGATTAIVAGPDEDGDPQFSRDGAKLAFARSVGRGKSQIYVVGADGTSRTLVTPEPLEIVSRYEFSPDGKTLVIASGTVTRRIVSIASVDASRFETIPFDGPAHSPAFRPGRPAEIAFTGRLPGTFETEGIFGYDLETRKVTTIVPPEPGVVITGGPAFSPDGATIAYGKWNPTKNIMSRIYTIDADAATQPRLLPPPTDPFCCEGYPTWSNDGSRIAHLRIYGDGVLVVIAPADTGGKGIEIGHAQMAEAALTWSPDDRFLLVQPYRDSWMTPMQQFLIDTATGTEIPVAWTTTSTPTWQRLAP